MPSYYFSESNWALNLASMMRLIDAHPGTLHIAVRSEEDLQIRGRLLLHVDEIVQFQDGKVATGAWGDGIELNAKLHFEPGGPLLEWELLERFEK